MLDQDHFSPGPKSLAAARRDVLDPPSLHPAVIQSNWLTLKEARGETVYLTRLSKTAHLIDVEPNDVVAAIDAVRSRVIGRVHQLREGANNGPGDAA